MTETTPKDHADQPVGGDHPPSKEELLKTTAVAAVVALAALLFFVLPAEYGIDPTGFGSAIGIVDAGPVAPVHSFQHQDAGVRNETVIIEVPASGAWREVKFDLSAGMGFVFGWNATGQVQFDLHHDALGSFDAGEAMGRSGSFTAPEDGRYGWAFRSPTGEAQTITLRVSGFWNDG